MANAVRAAGLDPFGFVLRSIAVVDLGNVDQPSSDGNPKAAQHRHIGEHPNEGLVQFVDEPADGDFTTAPNGGVVLASVLA
jgi:hypothetical protein